MECEISQKGPLLRISDLLGFDHTYMRVILPYAPVPCQISATILVKAAVLYHIVPYCGLDQYTPLVEVNQAIYAWSFRQKVLWVGGWWVALQL